MQCPKCGYENVGNPMNCARCHINMEFARLNSALDVQGQSDAPPAQVEDRPTPKGDGNSFLLVGLVLILGVLVVLMFSPIGWLVAYAIACGAPGSCGR